VEVGVRELRDNMRRYLDQVVRGREVVVTDRGRPIARLVPATSSIERLIAAGLVIPANEPKRSPSRRIVPVTPLDDVGDERGL
jgi:prevent-host-death family protein